MSEIIHWSKLTPVQRDRIVAEKIFRWQPVECNEEITIYSDGEAWCSGCHERDHISTFEHGVVAHLTYSQSMDCAWRITTDSPTLVVAYEVLELFKFQLGGRYTCRIYKGKESVEAKAATAPEAICIAALMLAGYIVENEAQ